jgi:ParB/RepB/Spo0J family partition protein
MANPKSMAKIVPVKLRDIQSNPFRDFSIYAIQEYKIAELIESINETDFWETVIGRRKGKKVQIAFGHHRVEAARRLYKPDDTIPIIIKDLSDDRMRKMMIRENKAEWGCLPAAIDDAVKAARDHLDKHRAEARKALSSVRPEVKRVRVGAPAIAKYTGYSETIVELSLQRLGWIESGEVDAKALYQMPNQAAAMRFAKAVLERPACKPYQKSLADHIVKEGRFGEASIAQALMEFVAIGKPTDPLNPRYYEVKLITATRLIYKAATALGALDELNQVHIMGGLATKEDISRLVIDNYNEAAAVLSREIEAVGKVLDRKPLKSLFED